MGSVNSNLIKINPFIWFGFVARERRQNKNKNKTKQRTKKKQKSGELDERACMNSVR